MSEQITLALLGAGGKMGCRITDHLNHNAAYSVRCVETGERGLASLAERGLKAVARDEALVGADAVIPRCRIACCEPSPGKSFRDCGPVRSS